MEIENQEHIESVNPQATAYVKESTDKVIEELSKVVIGQKHMIELMIAGMLSGGHVLIEGVPGIAKTLIVKLLSRAMDLEFKRIQFTPDLMPADVTGTGVYNQKSGEFEFHKGPIFANLVLIDEINRAPAKTQAALFEVMEETQITVDGKTHVLNEPFMVLATQNPIEQEGTYSLPEAQQDRFLFRIVMEYPSQAEELMILERFESDFDAKIQDTVQVVMKSDVLIKCKNIVESVSIDKTLLEYIASIIHKTRVTGDLYLGASPRASLALLKSSKALAAMDGRNYVIPEDIKRALFPVLNHRVILAPDREMEGVDLNDVLKTIIAEVEIPR